MGVNTQFLAVLFFFSTTGLLSGQERTFNLNDSPDIEVLKKASTETQSSLGITNALRYRELFINPVLQSSEIIKVGDTILLDVFNDRSYKALVNKVGTDINGTFTINATLPAYKFATCEISSFEKKSFLVLDIPEKNELYKANYIHKVQSYYIKEVDKSQEIRLEGSPSVIPEASGLDDSDKKKQNLVNAENAFLTENPETITLLVAYTPAAAEWSRENETNINTTISALMSRSQTAMDNSNTLINLQLVHSFQVDYTEQDSAQDLDNLQGIDDGFMDTIHDLRNAYGADLVVLLGEFNFTGGLAYLLNTISGLPEWAFSLTRVQQASWTTTVVHEIAHNMGCSHHKEQNDQAGPGLFPYSSGWRWTGSDGITYSTVMTYQSGEYWEDSITSVDIGYFSDPDILFEGISTGNINDANNARTLRETKAVVASYRDNPEAIIIISPRSNDIWRTGSEYNIVWEDNKSENLRIELYKGDEIVDTLSASLSNDGNFVWSVPTELLEGSDYRIKISSLSDMEVFGFSNHFTILAPPCEDEYEPEGDIVNVNVSAFDRILGDSAYKKSIYGTIHDEGDWDYYQLNIGREGGLRLTLSSVPDGFDLQLFNSNNELVASSITPGDEEISEVITDTGIYYILVGSLVGDSSCTPYMLSVEWGVEPPFLRVEPSLQELDYSSGEVVFNVESNIEWSATEDATWLSVTKTSPEILTVSYTENTSTDTRSAEIVFSGERIPSKMVSVIQQGATCFVDVIPGSQRVDSLSGTVSLGVNSNVDWSVSDDASWVSVAREDSLLIVSYEANPGISDRTAIVTISGGDCSEIFTLTQAGDEPEFSVKTSKLSLEAMEGSSIAFNIETNTDWYIENIPAWTEITPSSGTGSASVSVKIVEANHSGANRVDTVFVVAAGMRLPVVIEQGFITGVMDRMEAAVRIYPNPSNQVLYVDLDGSLTDFSIRISDSQGAYVYSKSYGREERLSINLGEFKPGMYQMEILSEQGRSVKSFVKF